MKTMFHRTVAALVVLLAALAYLAVPTGWAAVAPAAPAPWTGAGDMGRAHLAPRETRMISIPIGIDSTLTLGDDGREVRVVGHAPACPEGSERFSVDVVVAQVQASSGGYGAGNFTAELPCPSAGEVQSWQMTVEAEPGTTFEEGKTWACASWLFLPPEAGSELNVIRWCYGKDVTIERADAEEAPPPAQGVASELALSADGQEIEVVGHASCPEGATSFRVTSIAMQDESSAYGEAPLTAEMPCAGEEQSWTTTIQAEPGKRFVEGETELCASVLYFTPESKTRLPRDCYDGVTLNAAGVGGAALDARWIVASVVTLALAGLAYAAWKAAPWA